MNYKGISFRLNTFITSVAILIVAAIVCINFYLSKEILVDKIEKGAIEQSNLVISEISKITVRAEAIAKNVSYLALYHQKYNNLDLLLDKVKSANSNILESIHIELFATDKEPAPKFSASKSGQLIQTPDYIQNFKLLPPRLNKGIWAEPFYCGNDSSNQLVSHIFPVTSSETSGMVGIVSCEISLLQLQKILNSFRLEKTGVAFIIDKWGNYITYPGNERKQHRNVFNDQTFLKEVNLEEINRKIRNGQEVTVSCFSSYYNNQKVWVHFVPLADVNWTIITVIPRKELFREINMTLNKVVLISGLGILLLFLSNLLIFRRILKPLVRVIHAIQKFTSVPGKEEKTKDEIKMLAESLENWHGKYGSLVTEQSKTAKEKQKIQKDLESAREIQLNIVPSGKPEFAEHPEIELYAVMKPAEAIGGDLYDYFFIDENRLLIAIGDVSGKGIPASLFMAIASTLIKTHAKVLSSKEIVSRVNDELSKRNSNQYFLTLFVGILDVKTGILDYCNAAHNFPYVLTLQGEIKILSKSHGLPPGIFKNKTYKSSTIELKEGDLFLLYTDGVINARSTNGKHYGVKKLEQNIRNLLELSSEEVVNRLVKSVVIYEGENRQSDDITIMAIKYLKPENQA